MLATIARVRRHEPIAESLMIPLVMILGDKLSADRRKWRSSSGISKTFREAGPGEPTWAAARRDYVSVKLTVTVRMPLKPIAV
jgi:hypothetical protein